MAAGQTSFLNGSPPLPADGVSPNPWQNPAAGIGAAPAAGSGGFLGVIQGLIGQLGAMIAQLGAGTAAPAAASQNVADATFASTGDPHLSETGTLQNGSGGTTGVNTHFDSMSAHADLLDSQNFAGGYQLSTTVTAPNAKGVTYNQSATVQLNNGLDSVTLNNDGSYAIQSGGTAMSLNPGQSIGLSGGTEVTRNANGSLQIAANNGSGGWIDTTLKAQAGGVDVSAAAHDVTVGGDIVAQNASPSAASTAATPVQAAYTSPLDAGLTATPLIPTPIAIPSILTQSPQAVDSSTAGASGGGIASTVASIANPSTISDLAGLFDG